MPSTVDVRGDECLPQDLDDRDRRTDARLEAELHAGLGCGSEQIGAPLRDQLLVGRDDRLAGAEKLDDVIARRLDSTHDLGDDGDCGVVSNRAEVAREHALGRHRRPLLADVPNERPDDPEAVPGRALDVVRALAQEPVDGRADRAVSEKTDRDVDRGHAPPPS
jgi:hypothetical protein